MPTCASCSCSAACATVATGQVLLASRVGHTTTALRRVATQLGLRSDVLAPGLLSIDTDDAHALVAAAGLALTDVEAAEVRCLVAGPGQGAGPAQLLAAMSAPSLSAASARVRHADLVPLFEDEERSFHSVYQPIVELGSGRTVAYEALLRAVDPAGGVVLPDAIFPAAEAAGWTNLVDRIGRTTALRDAGGWLGERTLFINFVPTSIYRPEVCLRTTTAAARRAGVRLDQVVFEVTESARVRDLAHLARVFDYYRRHGCRVALDDLGEGYSSLNMLVTLQPDIVKLDKTLVHSLPRAVGKAVVAAIVQITRSYGGVVLAECIETPEQAQAALELGVDLGQGWLFGAPQRMSAEHALPAPAQPTRAAADA